MSEMVILMVGELKRMARYSLVVLMLLSGVFAFGPAYAQNRGLPDFTELVEQVGPAVVNIRVLKRPDADASDSASAAQIERFRQEMCRRLFGMPCPPEPQAQRSPESEQQEEVQFGEASGFVLASDGLIMTNAHVVDGADTIFVTLPDKREFKARIVGVDKRTDIAVLKVDATGLPAVKPGDVSRLKVGEWVIAIGSPFGLESTVTAGIVSAKQRDTGDYLLLLQTDVAINPGNSGGPLINMRGEVVGINSQIFSRSGGYMGISFAIPIDEAIRVSEQLRANGRVSRGRIGVHIDQVSKDDAEASGLGKPQGALVRRVEAGSPAEKAGVEAGDIIVRLGSKAIEKPADLPRAVGGLKPGTRSTLTVFRRGASKELTVTIGEYEPEKPVARKEREDKPRVVSAPALGLTVADLNETQKKELRSKEGVRVMAVTEVAARAGLREGDVILALANIQVTNAQEFEAMQGRLEKGKPVSVLFRRGDWAHYAVIRPQR